MRCIELQFRSGGEFLSFYVPPAEGAATGGSLFVKTLLPLRESQPVIVDIEVASAMERCAVSGVVVECPALLQVDGRARRGARILIDADEQAMLDTFLEAIHQDLGEFHARKLDRSGMNMEVEAAEFGGPAHAVPVVDFSAGGIFLATPLRPVVGQMVQLRLIAPDYGLNRVVVGEVAWHGYKEEHEGVGVRFVFKTSGERREWRSIFSRVQRVRDKRLTEDAIAAVRSSA